MLRLTNVNCYYGTIHCLKNISMHVEDREIVVLIGSNGSGKTSLLKAILGRLPLCSGEIAFQGLYQGGLAMVVASLLYTRAVVALGPQRLAFFTSVVPALAALAAWLFWGERFSPLGYLGAGLVLLGVVWMVLGPQDSPRGQPKKA
jgi:drug/metabolite transporter (DMT)-like permease